MSNQVRKNDGLSHVNKDTLLEAVGIAVTKNAQLILNKYNESKASINVLRRELDSRLIKVAIDMIRNEHSSLLATFE